jgi:hypothetical protein
MSLQNIFRLFVCCVLVVATTSFGTIDHYDQNEINVQQSHGNQKLDDVAERRLMEFSLQDRASSKLRLLRAHSVISDGSDGSADDVSVDNSAGNGDDVDVDMSNGKVWIENIY